MVRLRMYKREGEYFWPTGRSVLMPECAYEQLREQGHCAFAEVPRDFVGVPDGAEPASIKTTTRRMRAVYENTYGAPQLVGVYEE